MNDDRSVANPNINPLSSVVAIDATFSHTSFNGVGSGIVIGPSHVLTAGHVVYKPPNVTQGARVMLSADVSALLQPRIVHTTDSNGNLISSSTPVPNTLNATTAPLFPLNYPNNTGDYGTDIALLTTTVPITTEQNALGMAVFLDPNLLSSAPITTAGFPGTFSDGTQDSRSDDNTARTLYSATGTVESVIDSERRISYSESVDTQGGQSGSGVWYDGDLFGENAELIVAVHTRGTPDVFANDGGDNSGVLISKGIYDTVMQQMEADSGRTNANQLPENVIVGTDSFSKLSIIPGGADEIDGSYTRERLLGLGGDDILRGAGANDRLDGGHGLDQAHFAGNFQDFSYTENADGSIEFTDNLASDGLDEGADLLKSMEFAIFEKADKNDNDVFVVPLPIEDGPLSDVTVAVTNTDGDAIGALTLESPNWMFDGDVDYTFTIGGSALGTVFNFAYVIDVSGSMGSLANGLQTRLEVAQEAYETLTQSLIDSGVADVSQFAVVPFNHLASLDANLDAQGAITAVNNQSPSGGTTFGPALATAESWFESINAQNATNIAFFLSDGIGQGASASLQELNDGTPVEVRTFGIGNSVNIDTLNIIDSDNAVVLTNPTDLIDAFQVSGLSRDQIDRIDVKLDGVIVDTIQPSALTDSELGLRATGTIDGLEVSKEAENSIEFNVVFSDGRPNAIIQKVVTTGQEETIREIENGSKFVDFSVLQTNFLGSILGTAESVINANDLSNEITDGAGNDRINAHGGDDIIILSGGGSNVVDGGDGLDTVRFDVTETETGEVSKVGSVVNVGNNSLIDVELIEFADRLISTDALQEILVASVTKATLTVEEDGGPDAQNATFEVTLNKPAATTTIVEFRVVGGTAAAGSDFTGSDAGVVILAGQQTARFDLAILDDSLVEGNETIEVEIELPKGVVFEDGLSVARVGTVIEDSDTRLSLSSTGFPSAVEGDAGATSPLTFSVERLGNTDGALTVDFSVSGIGSSPANADDFVGGSLPSGTLTFVDGQRTADFDVEVSGDDHLENDEAFQITFSNSSRSVPLPAPTTFTILNDDVGIRGTDRDDRIFGDEFDNNIQGLGGSDIIKGRGGDDFIDGGAGDDIIKAGDGNDTLLGEHGRDYLAGQRGNDILEGGDDNDRLWGGRGDDQLFGGEGHDKLIGGRDDDLLHGGGGDDRIYGGRGDDELLGNEGRDQLVGGRGDDGLQGGAGRDYLHGGRGDDYLDGGEDDDRLNGGRGDDVLSGGGGRDYLRGGRGSDTFLFETVSAFEAIDRIKDFSLRQGDIIDIHDLLVAFDPLTDNVEDFVEVSHSGRDSVLSVDPDGGGDDFSAIALIKRGKNLELQDLIDHDSLLIA